MKFLGVPGVFDYAGLNRNSRWCSRSCCLPPLQERRRPDCIFSELNTHPTYSPVYASLCISRCPAQNSGPSGSLVLSREASSSSASCRFSPAHCNRDFSPIIVTGVPHSVRVVGCSDCLLLARSRTRPRQGSCQPLRRYVPLSFYIAYPSSHLQ